MLPRRPGPSSTTRGAPVSTTGSPGFTPLVSSYTWMIVLSPAILMPSPMSCSSPTNWTSYIRGRSPVAVTTGPATRKISPTAFAPASFATDFIAMSCTLRLKPESLVQVDADRPLDLRAEVLLFLLPHRNHDRAGRRLQLPPHRVREGGHLVRAEDEDPDVRVLEDLRDLRLESLPGNADGLPDPSELESLDEVVPADGSDLHLRSPTAPESPREGAHSPYLLR